MIPREVLMKVGDLVRVREWCSWYGDVDLVGIGVIVKILDSREEVIVYIGEEYRTLHKLFLEVIKVG